ncbi:MAG: BlaI/MecI/CopY family transcriptional regulator [Nitrospinota bacterium]
MKGKGRQEAPQAFRPGAEGLKQVLGDLEAEIMETVWTAEEQRPGTEVSVRDVVEKLVGRRALAYATVKTVMNRLVEKGHLIRRKLDRAFLYRSRRSRDEFWRQVCGSVMQGLLSGPQRGAVLSHLVESVSGVDAENLDRLADLIEEKRRELERPPGRQGGVP